MSDAEQAFDDRDDPNAYDDVEGRHDRNGLEKCPRCERLYSGNGGYTGPVADQDGDRYDSIMDTEPEDGPFFCERCFDDMKRNRDRAQHKTLDRFAALGGEQA